MKVVLDTNVLVSALLRPAGPPGRILGLVLARHLTLAIDSRIFAEYCEVLGRPELAISADAVGDLVDFIWRRSERVHAAPLSVVLPDPDDLGFLEVAVTASADALITGNLKHFPPESRRGVRVLSPREWLTVWTGEG